jgi:hypothetical protein
MTVKKESPWYVGQRSEILAQLFLEDLGATSVAPVQGNDIGFDCFATFESPDGATKTIAVEIKAVEEELTSPPSIALPRRLITRWLRCNVPVLVLVIDVKHNRTYFNWAKAILESNSGTGAPDTKRVLSAPLREGITEELVQLKQEIQST